MIRITVDLVSAVHPSRSRRLGVAEITNDGTGAPVGRCHYDAVFRGPNGGAGRRGHVENYPRNSVSVWNLIRRALENAGYTR